MKNILYNSLKKIGQLIIVLIAILMFAYTNFMYSQVPNIEWQKCLGGSNGDYGAKVKKTSDGGYILTGSTNSNDGDVSGNNGMWDFWMVKLDDVGLLLWQNTLGGPLDDFANDIFQTSDGGYIAVGQSDGNGGDVTGNHGDTDVWVVKMNASGNLEWQRSLGGSEWDKGNSIVQDSDGNYVIAGLTGSNDGNVSGNHGLVDYWVVKIDTNGDILWQKTFGGTLAEEAFSLVQTNSGGFIVGGIASSSDGDVSINKGEWDYWLINIDSDGNLLWEKSFGGTSFDSLRNITKTSNGGYIVMGYTLSTDGDITLNNGEGDIWIVKLDSSGNLMWQKSLGGSNDDFGNEIIQLPNQGYIIIAETYSNNGNVSGNHGNTDYWVANLNTNGIVQWQKCLGGSDTDLGRSIQISNDGGYLLAGSSSSNNGNVSGNHGSGDFWIVKLSPDLLENPEFTTKHTVLYPNPVKNFLHIETSKNIGKVHIYNILGQTVYNKTHQGNAISLNFEHFTKGVYIVEITNGNHLEVYKILKE